MPTTRRPDQRRCIPVCLRDIPVDVRIKAAHRACRAEWDPVERQRIVAAALVPSRTIYWIAA